MWLLLGVASVALVVGFVCGAAAIIGVAIVLGQAAMRSMLEW